MLNKDELKNYRKLRGVSQEDVARFCDISKTLIVMLENGDRNLTEENYQEFINGINAAYQAKKNGTLKPKLQNVMKTEKPKTTQKKKSELKRI